MNRQIEKLKRDIAADSVTARALEIQELAFRLEDLSDHMNSINKPGADVEALVESTTRSYWAAMILARKAIEVAGSDQKLNRIEPECAVENVFSVDRF